MEACLRVYRDRTRGLTGGTSRTAAEILGRVPEGEIAAGAAAAGAAAGAGGLPGGLGSARCVCLNLGKGGGGGP